VCVCVCVYACIYAPASPRPPQSQLLSRRLSVRGGCRCLRRGPEGGASLTLCLLYLLGTQFTCLPGGGAGAPSGSRRRCVANALPVIFVVAVVCGR